jgi:hypothetical protein
MLIKTGKFRVLVIMYLHANCSFVDAYVIH